MDPLRPAALPVPQPAVGEPGSKIERPSVLMCDHRGESASERARWLSAAGLPVELAPTLRAALERLSSQRPTVIVLDPLGASGIAEIEAIDQARQGDPRPGLLVVTDDGAAISPALAQLRTAERGPWDFVRRTASAEEFVLRVSLLRHQVDALREMERLRHLATHDDRTDLLRPQVFQDQLRQHFSASQRHRLNMALLLIDLDDFGSINKVHNHTVGDAVISRVGAAIRSALRVEDVAGRIGGDEFCVLLPYTRKVDAARVVQRLLDQIRDISGSIAGTGQPVRVSASVGFQTFNGTDLESVERLRLHAEEALRVAKRAGGDRGVYYRNLDSARRGELDLSADEEQA